MDLFSGIGGFALASSWVWGDEYENIGHSEVEKYACKVYHRHFPTSPCLGDITKIKWQERQADIITGGFPCQPFSVAGKRRGNEDDRALWPEMFRAIREVRPTWVLAENVAGIINMELDNVLSDLEISGYKTQAFVIPACAVNAPHKRDRVWIVAHANQNGKMGERRNGSSDNVKRNASQKIQERENILSGIEFSDREAIANTNSQHGKEYKRGNQLRQERSEGTFRRGIYEPTWQENWLEVATCLCRVDDGLPRQLDRVQRLKALGNAIVPQVAEQILRAIKLFDNAKPLYHS